MYAAIRQVKAKPGLEDALREKLKGAVAVVSNVPGFLGYYVIYSPDDTLTAISLFNTVEQAEESNRRALAWIDKYLAGLLTGAATATAGPVVAHAVP
jgi:quinol monooxygenase YgiN